MTTRLQQGRLDWMFGGLMFVLCVILTVLQYQWTGRLADAEQVRLHGNLAEQTQALARSFDNELSHSCAKLLPTGNDITEAGIMTELLIRYQNWKATGARPIFRRIVLALPRNRRLVLFEVDPKAVALKPVPWPGTWENLQENLSRKHLTGSPPFSDSDGQLLEFPILPGTSGPAGEAGWLILQQDEDYLRHQWLPDLINNFLFFDNLSLPDARVRTADQPSQVLFSSIANPPRHPVGMVAVAFNRIGKTSDGTRAPAAAPHWILETWLRPGALEGVVAVSRLRNLGVSALLILMMLATGLALLFYTRRARQLAETRMRFVANVSHELRTPLTVIRGAAHNLKRGIVHQNGQIENYSKLIIEHADDLTDMIEQVLTLARAQKGDLLALRQTIPLNEILQEAVAATAHDILEANCTLHLELPSALPSVKADPVALRRVFQNLITNAAKHGGHGGWIGITALSEEHGLHPTMEIHVSDRGPGIPPNELSNIFQPFFRGTAAQARQTRGSGLGLSLVREIVEAHGGTVSVESNDGNGTTFTVRLPVTSNPET